MVLPAEEGHLITSASRVLVATAVPVERDAVAEAFPGPARERRSRGEGPLWCQGGRQVKIQGNLFM
ncbi:futalosine hydrolase, partial [Streptomyces sp. NPDC004976]